ncbi:MAG: hypothetical protein Tsb002_34300 [Wenzhouxiangellaceae bacterium]
MSPADFTGKYGVQFHRECDDFCEYDYVLIKTNKFYIGLIRHEGLGENDLVLFVPDIGYDADEVFGEFLNIFPMPDEIVKWSYRDKSWYRGDCV